MGGYRLEALLARSAPSLLFRARGIEAGEEVLLEVPRVGLREAEGFAEQMRRDSVTAAGLHHPHIAQTTETGVDDGVPYAVSPDIDGVELTPLVEGLGGLSLVRASGMISQVAGALAAAHAADMVHGTVEPSRVLVAHRDGVDQTTLTGFGFTPPPGSDGDSQRPFGVPAAGCASPEQIRGEPPTAASDVYALGCVLYHALLAELPMNGANDTDTLEAHLKSAPPRISDHAPELPAELDDLLARALAKDPADRHVSPDELAAELEQIAGERAPGSTVSARKRDTTQRWEESIAGGAHEWSPSKPVITWPQAGSQEVKGAAPPESAAPDAEAETEEPPEWPQAGSKDVAGAAPPESAAPNAEATTEEPPEWPQPPHDDDTPAPPGGKAPGGGAAKNVARVLAGLVALAAVVGLVALALSGDDDSGSGSADRPPARADRKPPAPAPREAGALTSWPRRDAYTVVIYVGTGNRAPAEARARQAAALDFRAGVLQSSKYPNLPPGRVVAFAGVYDSLEQAERATARLRREGVAVAPYVRQIKGAGA